MIGGALTAKGFLSFIQRYLKQVIFPVCICLATCWGRLDEPEFWTRGLVLPETSWQSFCGRTGTSACMWWQWSPSCSYYIFVPDCTGRKQESSLLTFIFQIQTEGERCSGEGRTSRGRKSKLTVGGWVGGAVVSECVCLWGGPRHLSEPTFLCIPGIPQTKRGERARNWPRLCLSTADLSDRDFKDPCTYMPDPRGHKKNTFMTRCMYVHTTQDMWRNGSLAHSVYLFIYWNNHRYYRKRSTFYSF